MDIHAKWLKRRVFTQGCAFCSKSRYFSYPLISRPTKRSKFRKFLDFFARPQNPKFGANILHVCPYARKHPLPCGCIPTSSRPSTVVMLQRWSFWTYRLHLILSTSAGVLWSVWPCVGLVSVISAWAVPVCPTWHSYVSKDMADMWCPTGFCVWPDPVYSLHC